METEDDHDAGIDVEVASVQSYDTYNYEMVEKNDGEHKEEHLHPISEVSSPDLHEENKENIPAHILHVYFKKFLGVKDKIPPPMQKYDEMVISSFLAFTGIILVSITDNYFLYSKFEVDNLGIKMLTGAYAATSVLIYEAYQSPLAQPRNVLGSYTVASFLGVSTRLVCDLLAIPRFVTGPLAVAIGLLGMNLTKTVHPPGGACALIAVIGGPMVEDLGYAYVLTSFGAAFIMLCVAVLGNNLFPSRHYPLYWY